MFLLRILAVLSVIAVGVGVVAYVATNNPKYIRFSWRVFRYAVMLALLIFALMVLERVAVIPL
ncbi:MAG: hypothetical protein KGN39_06840 [Betaproteobacteria bacterium]|nr:hypothetical protein [Betaproteobacteria bacterium]